MTHYLNIDTVIKFKPIFFFNCRFHNVTGGPIEPVWTPFSTVRVFEENLFFSLKLKTGKTRSCQEPTPEKKQVNKPYFTYC